MADTYNLFKPRKSFDVETPQMQTKPIPVYDTSGQGTPSAENISAAYQTPTAKLQMQTTPVTKPTYSIPNVNPQSPTDGMDFLSSMYTSPEQEEKYRKAALANQRITAVADALRHIGNIYNTVNYAPAQQLNNATQVEADRYLKGKALRDQANMRYLTYQQQKAAQDARIKQYERDYALKMADAARKAGYTEAQIKNMQDRLEEQRANNEANRALREKLGLAQQEERVRHNKVSEHQGQQRIGLAATNSRNAENHRQWVRNNKGGSGNPYVLPTKNGYITLGRDLNSNQIGKKALYGKLKEAGIVDQTWIGKMDNSGYTPEEKAALLNTAISQWLMKDDKAPEYMATHYGAKYSNETDSAQSPYIGWDDEDDEDDNVLEIGW